METILEQQRRYHEERERLCDSMVKEMLIKKASVSLLSSNIFVLPAGISFFILYIMTSIYLSLQFRDSINSEHRLKMLLDVSIIEKICLYWHKNAVK